MSAPRRRVMARVLVGLVLGMSVATVAAGALATQALAGNPNGSVPPGQQKKQQPSPTPAQTLTLAPTPAPTAAPTPASTAAPTLAPTPAPTTTPTSAPTPALAISGPTPGPTVTPSSAGSSATPTPATATTLAVTPSPGAPAPSTTATSGSPAGSTGNQDAQGGPSAGPGGSGTLIPESSGPGDASPAGSSVRGNPRIPLGFGLLGVAAGALLVGLLVRTRNRRSGPGAAMEEAVGPAVPEPVDAGRAARLSLSDPLLDAIGDRAGPVSRTGRRAGSTADAGADADGTRRSAAPLWVRRLDDRIAVAPTRENLVRSAEPDRPTTA